MGGIVMANLHELVRVLNTTADMPQEYRQVGNYHIDSNGLGVRLFQFLPQGELEISPRLTKGELYQWIHAFIKGIESVKYPSKMLTDAIKENDSGVK
jgi:hypothetical protein